jgi:hypothetical protein
MMQTSSLERIGMRTLVAMLSLALLPACVSYSGLKPIYPDAGHPVYHIVNVGTLQPTLRWEAASAASAGYDLVIFEGPETLFGYVNRGDLKRVYSREGIMKPEHSLEGPLNPGLVYFWSVKVHGDDAPAWSRYNYSLCIGIYFMHASDQLYRFRTPAAQQL